MYHCIALSYSHCIIKCLIIKCMQGPTDTKAVRHTARVCPSTTQHGLNYHCIALHRNPVWRLVKVQGWCPHLPTQMYPESYCFSVALVRNTFHGCVEPMPCTGKVNQMYFGWVWSGRCAIPAKSVGKIRKNWLKSAMSQLSCKTRCQ